MRHLLEAEELEKIVEGLDQSVNPVFRQHPGEFLRLFYKRL
jgi:hypothetical protein